MKLKFTPLVVAAIALLLYAIYYLFGMLAYEKGGNLGGLVVLVCIFTAAISILLSLGSRKIFKTNIWGQVIMELALIIMVAFLFYKNNGRLMLNVPRNYTGYIIIVYGAQKEAKLPTTMFKANTEITVPSSGIILTSSGRDKGISVIDSTNTEVKIMKAGYDFPYSWDSLNCGNKVYDLDVLLLYKISGRVVIKRDTSLLNSKKAQACEILRE